MTRTITTVEEMEALPIGSIVMDCDRDAWQNDEHGWNCTVAASNSTRQPAHSIVAILGPVTVLWEPGRD